jgi:hypothetical protein
MHTTIENSSILQSVLLPCITGPGKIYTLQQVTYSVAPLPTGTTVTWSASSNVTFVSGQTGSSVIISICGSSATSATLTATLSGTVSQVLTKTIVVNNGELYVTPGVGYIDVEFSQPYAQCFDWYIEPPLTSQIGNGNINCSGSNSLRLTGAENGQVKVRGRSGDCVTPWITQQVNMWRPEFDMSASYFNPWGPEPFYAYLVEPAPDDGKSTISYYWYFGGTLFSITGGPDIYSWDWPCGDYNFTVVVHIDDGDGHVYEAEASTGFWGMC